MTPRKFMRTEAISQGLDGSAVDAALATFDVESYADRRFGNLSTGQRQRVSIAAATLGRPELLILDEPTNGLDIEAIQWLRSLVQSRTSDALTTIVSSHNLPELERMTNRTLVLKTTLRFDGNALSGDPGQAEDRYLELVSSSEGAQI
jgi:ABC-2 type transport system ATP-binding protein